MRNTLFKCPICGSTHFKHSFPRDKNTPVFLAKCSKCRRYECWVNKEDYKNWTYPSRNKNMIHDVVPSQYAKTQVMIHQLLLHFGFKMNLSNKNTYKLVKNDLEYTVNISDDIVDVKDLVYKTRKKYPLDSLIKKLIKLVKEGQ